jgi:hypothetical protein
MRGDIPEPPSLALQQFKIFRFALQGISGAAMYGPERTFPFRAGSLEDAGVVD